MEKSKPVKKARSSGKKNAKKKPPALFPIVAIGASAGGLDAMSDLLEHLPANLGMAYVIIQHLAPHHKSILPELLEKKTDMPVHKVEDNMHVKPDQVYVIPPNTFMSIIDSKLKLMPRTKSDGTTYHSIDYFFSALAPVYKNNAIGIILSGTANDGTLGVKEIKAAGGITFAQDETAKYQGMPRSAVDAGYVDFVLSPKEIARELKAISKNPFGMDASKKSLPENEEELKRIFVILNTRQGVDFSCYKKSTIYRRIIRRMVLNRLKSLKGYVQLLRENEKEVRLLYHDLLINVTGFFRDPSIYQALIKNILPKLVKDRRATDPVRIWVPGCATGEEACSIAICLIEFFNQNGINTPIQIFATDLNGAAIEQARTGIYLKNTLENMSPQQLNRFFTKTNGSYQVIKPVRDACIFAPHNLLKDPPFSRIDIISCHNVLIYLEPASQKKILHGFHYSLKPDGFLLLGKSETTGNSGELFEPVDKENKIYTKKAVSNPLNFNFPTRTSYQEPNVSEKQRPAELDPKQDIEKETDKILLNEYVPASVLINKDMNIIGFRGATSPYLEPASGKASLHLLKMVRDELVFELRTMINKAKKEVRTIKKEKIPFQMNGQHREVTIEVVPIQTKGNGASYLTVFRDVTPPPGMPPVGTTGKGKKQDASRRQIESLERQLKDAREHIKSMSEEHESVREELQSSNEEVLSSNEELQSMNEELETSQEELQSTNEELTTINDEMQHRNIELKEAINYTDAIVRTMREPLIILNQELRVSTANDSYYKLFGGSPAEIEGNLFYEIENARWDDQGLRSLLKQINTENKPINDFKIKITFASIGERTILLNANQMLQEGKRSKILMAMEDITERLEIEKQKDDFISIAAHELKTPVTTLSMYAQLLLKEFIDQGDEKSKQLAGKMGKQVDRLIHLIENLLDLTRTAKGTLQYEDTWFDLNELITETIEQMQATTSNHKLIGQLQPAPKIRGDKNRIEQVLINLISNAIKYSSEADKVIIRSQTNAGNIEIGVKDFGMGIAEDMQENIFQRFFRTDASKKTFTGIGLGLYISSEIVKRHGGKIWVNSIEGEGSEFCFTLPVTEENSKK